MREVTSLRVLAALQIKAAAAGPAFNAFFTEEDISLGFGDIDPRLTKWLMDAKCAHA